MQAGNGNCLVVHGYHSTGCCRNPFSLGLKRFLIPPCQDSPRFVGKKRFTSQSTLLFALYITEKGIGWS